LSDTAPRIRIGIVPVGLEGANMPALKYLMLLSNQLQDRLEFELCNCDLNHPLLAALKGKDELDRDNLRDRAEELYRHLHDTLQGEVAKYRIQEPPPDYFIIVSLARLSENYYTLRRSGLSIIALHDWETEMSPPTLVEFILTLVMREAMAAACPSLRFSMHLGTKGCICDFTDTLEDARIKVLSPYVCGFCRSRAESDGQGDLPDKIQPVLSREWFGDPTDPRSPAAIAAKLGHDLFLTKGLQATPWERFTAVAHDEAAKWVVKALGAAIAAALFILLTYSGVSVLRDLLGKGLGVK
jgi:hypothetical protein